MSRRKRGGREYQVGYGKPPAQTRFQKGRSGNPRGRPRRTDPERVKALVIEEAYRLVTVREGDTLTRMPAIQAVLRAKMALAHGMRGLAIGLAWLNARLGHIDAWPEEADPPVLPRLDLSGMSQDDRVALRGILERHARRQRGAGRVDEAILEDARKQEIIDRFQERIDKACAKIKEKERQAEEVLQRTREEGNEINNS
jgi:hypothetical protein